MVMLPRVNSVYGSARTAGFVNVGTESSGNFGHEGRPGEVGGSGPGGGGTTSHEEPKLKHTKESWMALSVKERDRQANASVSVPARVSEHLSTIGEWQSTGDLDRDVDARINSAKDLLNPEAAHLTYETASRYSAVLRNAGVPEDKVTALTQLGTDYLIAQEIEAQGRQLGDHGVHHISGNIERSMQMLGVVPGEDTGEQEAAIFTANLFHDAGYLTEPAQNGIDEGHTRWSADNYDKNIRPSVEAALGREEAANVEHLIRTHDSTAIDWKSDPVGSSVRVADNTALFQADKLPPVFREVPGNLETLESFNAGEISLADAKTTMHAAVDNAKLPKSIAARYHTAVNEVNPATGKFTLGMLGGMIEKVSWADGHVAIDLKESPELTRVNKLGDFGQRQFGKFAETFGANADDFKKNLAFTFKGKDGVTLLEGRIIKAETAMLNVGTAASGNWGHAGRPGERGGSVSPGGPNSGAQGTSAGKTPKRGGNAPLGDVTLDTHDTSRMSYMQEKEIADSIRAEMPPKEDWSNPRGHEIADMALSGFGGRGSMLTVARNEDGEFEGLAKYFLWAPPFAPENPKIKIQFIASVGDMKHVGTDMLSKIIEKNPGRAVELEADAGAKGFYRHIGMTEDKDFGDGKEGLYSWTADEAAAFADKPRAHINEFRSVENYGTAKSGHRGHKGLGKGGGQGSAPGDDKADPKEEESEQGKNKKEGGRKKDPDKVRRAKESHVKQTPESIFESKQNEERVADVLNGTHVNDNNEFDVLKGKFAIEVKTLNPGDGHPKITMHSDKERDSLDKKWAYVDKYHVLPYAVAVDCRKGYDKPVYYIRCGLGSFVLSSMTQIDPMELGKMLNKKEEAFRGKKFGGTG